MPNVRFTLPLLVALCLALSAGCASESKDTPSTVSQTAVDSNADVRLSEMVSGEESDSLVIDIRTIQEIPEEHFSRWVDGEDIQLWCGQNYQIRPRGVDERLVDSFSSVPSLDQIPIHLTFSINRQNTAIPIQQGIDQAIEYSPGATFSMTVNASYRAKSTCGRLTITRTGSEAVEAFFSTWTTEDSIAVALQETDGSLIWGGIAPGSDYQSLVAHPSRKTHDEEVLNSAQIVRRGPNWILETSDKRRAVLTRLLSVGEWTLRPSDIVYEDHTRILTYTCDPYDRNKDFCGFPSQDGMLVADPPSPARIHFAIRGGDTSDSLIITPVWEENAGRYVLSQLADLNFGEETTLPLSVE